MILASQAFYMYLSNKTQFKTHRYLYLIAVPIAAAFPALLNSQDPQAYTLYEYAVVFCIVYAAVADSSLAAAFNREFITDDTVRSLIYSYFLMCTVAAFSGNTSITVRALTAFLLIGSFLMFVPVKKHSAMEFIKSIPLAFISVLSSWIFMRFGL